MCHIGSPVDFINNCYFDIFVFNLNHDFIFQLKYLILHSDSTLIIYTFGNFNSLLTVLFLQVVSTRWNSTLTMLKSVNANLASLKVIATDVNDHALQKLLLDVSEDLLTDTIAVLEPFDEATRYSHCIVTASFLVRLLCKITLLTYFKYLSKI